MTSRANTMNDSTRVNTSGMIPKPPEHVVMITTDAALADFAARMTKAAWIAVDTEFKRESTYYSQLCLVQVADTHEIGLIDVLAVEDLAPLAELMAQADLLKVFHAAEQDLEVLYQTLGVMPAPVFDTQIAAALAGYDDQMGYARLIDAMLDVALAKTHTRTDWTQRPLPEQVLAYAADDVRYLAAAYPPLRDELESLGRLPWLDADFAALADAQRFEPAPENAWKRLRAWQRLRPGQQQALALLAAWRECQAIRANRPRKWILKDDVLVEIAKRRPQDMNALARIDGLSDKTAVRHGQALLECIVAARQRPDENLAAISERLTEDQTRALEDAMAVLRRRAREAGISAGTLASRKELQRMVEGERELRVLGGWRAHVVGDALLDVVENRQEI